jgi:phosphatidyl-myo-inositol dimannoside synthase
VLLLATDAYGGHGGIALYNCDLAEALAAMPEVSEVVVIPRTLPFAPTGVPDKVLFLAQAAGSKIGYICAALRRAMSGFDLLICGHINLLPLAACLRATLRCPLVLMAYGIDVWTPPRRLTRLCLGQVNAIWSISAVTRERMNGWACLPESAYVVLPNAIHLDQYDIGTKSERLIESYGLHGRKVILTLARLPGSERYKGVDEVLETLPALIRQDQRLVYVVAGEGEDRPRLEEKSRALGLQDHVVFTGFVAEAEKADHFRLADAFVMPGRGEGFGFVFLEALACGVPVVGSVLDGSREALREGELGELVDPTDSESVRAGIERALNRPKVIPPGLAYFDWPNFCARLQAAVKSLQPSDLPGS